MSPTRACMMTPVGRGAIATVAVDGPDAVAFVDQLFRSATNKMVAKARIGRILFGRWHCSVGAENRSSEYHEAASEELVVCRTRLDRVEVHCHGGLAAAPRILASLESLGCQTIDWREWMRDRQDPIVAEATIAISQAVTSRTAAILLDQVQGALSQKLKQVEECIASDPQQASADLRKLQQTAQLGTHLTVPWRVVIAGPPNVGKSSLINALMGFERAIVFDRPGTTRDVVTTQTALDGWPIQLSDTAGLRVTNDELESQGVERALREIDEADLIIRVSTANHEEAKDIDTNTEDDHWDREMRSLLDTKSTPTVHVRNKIDLANNLASKTGLIDVSALKEIGMSRLCESIVNTLVPKAPDPGQAILFTERQRNAVQSSMASINANQLDAACETLRNLVG